MSQGFSFAAVVVRKIMGSCVEHETENGGQVSPNGWEATEVGQARPKMNRHPSVYVMPSTRGPRDD